MIQISHLAKKFGDLTALSNLSVSIEHSQVTAIIGPNGSGKSTLIKCLLGLACPDEGEIYVANHRIGKDAAYKAVFGYMPQVASFPENMFVGQLIRFMKNLRKDVKIYDEELIRQFKLDEIMDRELGTLSGGTKQKVNAVLTYLFNPKIVVLDEPTAGLDPVSSSVLKNKILNGKQAGITTIITSHILSELEELADSIIFLLDGKIAFNGSVGLLKRAAGESTLERSIAKLMEGGLSWIKPGAY